MDWLSFKIKRRVLVFFGNNILISFFVILIGSLIYFFLINNLEMNLLTSFFIFCGLIVMLSVSIFFSLTCFLVVYPIIHFNKLKIVLSYLLLPALYFAICFFTDTTQFNDVFILYYSGLPFLLGQIISLILVLKVIKENK